MSSSKRKLVRGALHKGVEGVARVQPCCLAAGGRCSAARKRGVVVEGVARKVVGCAVAVFAFHNGGYFHHQLAVAFVNFGKGVEHQLQVASEHAFFDVAIGHLEPQCVVATGKRDHVLESREPYRFRDLGPEQGRDRCPHGVVFCHGGLLSRRYGFGDEKHFLYTWLSTGCGRFSGVFGTFRHFFGGKCTIADYPQGKKMEPWLGMGAGLA